MKKICYGAVGFGERMYVLVEKLLQHPDVMLKTVFDPDNTGKARELYAKLPGLQAQFCGSYEEMLADREIEWVLVGSPNALHREHIVKAFRAGKHVFAEKPLATTVDDCVAIVEEQEKTGRLFATGFVLRYSPIYRKVKEIFDSGVLGTIVSVDANENIAPHHGAHIMTNWRRHGNLSGSHVVEKCCHDIDLLHWFIGSLPMRIAAFMGNNVFVPAHAHLFEEKPALYRKWMGPKNPLNPFTSDKSIEDNIVSIIEYANGARVQFQATTSNIIPERRMSFSCTQGNLVVELYSAALRWRSLSDAEEHTVSFKGSDLHGGGDQVIIDELHDTMVRGIAPRCGGREGLISTATGICIRDAAAGGTVIHCTELWKRLGVNKGETHAG